MSSIQTLYDVLFAVVLMVGISAALAIAATVAGAAFQRQQVGAASAAAAGTLPAEPTTEDARELMLR